MLSTLARLASPLLAPGVGGSFRLSFVADRRLILLQEMPVKVRLIDREPDIGGERPGHQNHAFVDTKRKGEDV